MCAVKDVFSSTPIPAPLSSIPILPLVQLLSQPASTLQLLDHTQALSEAREYAEFLLNQIEEGCEGVGDEMARARAPVCSGQLSCMASSLQQYLHVAQRPALMEAWLEAAVRGETAVSVECVALLVAASASQSIGRPEALKSALKAFGGLVEVLPKLVSQSVWRTFRTQTKPISSF